MVNSLKNHILILQLFTKRLWYFLLTFVNKILYIAISSIKNTLYKSSVVLKRLFVVFSPVASAIFTFRNIDKTENGEIGRAPVALGQAVGVLGEISKYDNAIAVSAKNVLSVFSDLSKENKFMNYAGKFAKFASDNVNPLIAVSGGVKVLMSDDKQSTAITEAAALSTMFGGEALVKKHYDKILNSTVIQNGLKKAASTKYLKPIFEFNILLSIKISPIYL